MNNENSVENSDDYILEFRNITKRFPSVVALDDVSFGIKRGTVHVIVGENGAGKSTLLKIIKGIYKADEGEIYFDGEPFVASGPTESLMKGISMIYQELNIIPEMTVLENMYLGRELQRKSRVLIDKKAMLQSAERYMEQQNLNFNLGDKMKNLSVAEAQMLEIVKAISVNAKIILMDEPTSSLTEKEFEYLVKKIADLKAQGITIIYISHKLEEVFQVGDYITVLRDGQHIGTAPAAEMDIPTIIEMMVGRKMNEVYPPKLCDIGEVIFEVKNFNRKGVFEDINFTLRKGEILGISGLIGAGRTEIARSIMAEDPKDSGEVYLNREKLKINSVNDAISYGIAHTPEDRRRKGLVLMHSVGDNIPLVAYQHLFKSAWLKHREIKKLVTDMIKRLSIRTPTAAKKTETLSGGNQQKVVLSKWLAVDPKILILDEPTRGIDVGTKYELYKLMHEMCNNGVSIILIDSDLEELIGMSDRALVVSQGRVAGILEKEEISANAIMHLAMGGKNVD